MSDFTYCMVKIRALPSEIIELVQTFVDHEKEPWIQHLLAPKLPSALAYCPRYKLIDRRWLVNLSNSIGIPTVQWTFGTCKCGGICPNCRSEQTLCNVQGSRLSTHVTLMFQKGRIWKQAHNNIAGRWDDSDDDEPDVQTWTLLPGSGLKNIVITGSKNSWIVLRHVTPQQLGYCKDVVQVHEKPSA